MSFGFFVHCRSAGSKFDENAAPGDFTAPLKIWFSLPALYTLEKKRRFVFFFPPVQETQRQSFNPSD